MDKPRGEGQLFVYIDYNEMLESSPPHQIFWGPDVVKRLPPKDEEKAAIKTILETADLL